MYSGPRKATLVNVSEICSGCFSTLGRAKRRVRVNVRPVFFKYYKSRLVNIIDRMTNWYLLRGVVLDLKLYANTLSSSYDTSSDYAALYP